MSFRNSTCIQFLSHSLNKLSHIWHSTFLVWFPWIMHPTWVVTFPGENYILHFSFLQIQRKRRRVARVQCRNIRSECPEPKCAEPVLLPGKCCKSCPGDTDSKCLRSFVSFIFMYKRYEILCGNIRSVEMIV